MTTSGRRYGQSTAMVQQTSFGVMEANALIEDDHNELLACRRRLTVATDNHSTNP